MAFKQKIKSKIQNIQSTKIHIQSNGSITSETYGDIYFQTDAIHEAQYVFLKHNDLPNRWQKSLNFTICELGFGCAINFLLTAQLWTTFLKSMPQENQKDKWMDFISIEKYPINKEQLLDAWKSIFSDTNISDKSLNLDKNALNYFQEKLIEQYPSKISGLHRIVFPKQRMTLNIYFGDISELDTIFMHVDAWYFDGFSPKVNPEMWCEDTFNKVAKLSHDGTTFSSFSCASEVQKSLKKNGFEIYKDTGFANKREMLYGHFDSKNLPQNILQKYDISQHEYPKSIAVIGGGLSGVITAQALAQRNKSVTIFEKSSDLCLTGASANPKCSLYISISGELNYFDYFYLHAHSFATKYFSNYKSWRPQTLLQITNHLPVRQARYLSWSERSLIPKEIYKYLSSEQMQQISKNIIERDGWCWQSGIMCPADMVKEAMSYEQNIRNIKSCINTKVLKIEVISLGNNSTKWKVITEDMKSSKKDEQIFDCVVLCNATGVNELLSPLVDKCILKNFAMRGQSSTFEINDTTLPKSIAIATPGITMLKQGNEFTLNATHNRDDRDITLRDNDDLENLSALLLNIPISHKWTINKKQSFAGIRCLPIDRAPFVGAVPDSNLEYLTNKINKSRNIDNFMSEISYLPNLYVNFAHGGKGLASIPLSSEYLASIIAGQSSPIPKDVMDTLCLSRLLVRSIKKHFYDKKSPKIKSPIIN